MSFLLVHGLGLSSNIWSHLIPFLTGKAITLDLPGHGEASGTDYSWSGLWASIVDANGQNEWSETILVLHSFSASLLPEILTANVHPKKIVMVEGILHPSDAVWSHGLTILDTASFKLWLKRFRLVSEMALRVQLCSRQSEQNIRIWSDSFKKVNGEALHNLSKLLRDRLGTASFLNAIESLGNHILYIRGGKSKLSLTGRAFLEEKSIQVRVVDGSAHFPMIDNPGAVAELIRRL